VRALWRPHGGISFGWWLVLMAAAYAATIGWGALVRAQQALVASLRERARRAEAEQGRRVAEARMLERTRIAREMHDVLAHRLSLLATYAGALEYRPDAPPEQLSQAAGVVRTGVHQALEELRDVIMLLRDDESTEDDAPAGRPPPALADLPKLVAESQDAGGDVRLDDRVTDPAQLPAATGRTAYRVVQEGLTNARKHAAGQPVRVLLDGRPGATLVIDIRNPLAGVGAATTTPGTGIGLVGLTERVQLAGGRLDHEVTAGHEFRLHASLPWPA
jgi:signal transduction histidine kinase